MNHAKSRLMLSVVFLALVAFPVFSIDLSDYFIGDVNKQYYYRVAAVTEMRTYQVYDINNDIRIGVAENIKNLTNPMFNSINGYAIGENEIELAFIRNGFGDRIVKEIIAKQPGSEWTIDGGIGERYEYASSLGSVNTPVGMYDNCLVIKKETYIDGDRLFSTEYYYYASNVGLVYRLLIGENGEESRLALIDIN